MLASRPEVRCVRRRQSGGAGVGAARVGNGVGGLAAPGTVAEDGNPGK